MKNWCTSREIADRLHVQHETAKLYVDVAKGKSFVLYHQTNEVKRINNNFETEYEYVINFPIDTVIPLLEVN